MNAKYFAIAAAALLIQQMAAASDIVCGAADRFDAITGVEHAKCERTPTSIKFTDIAFDIHVGLKLPLITPSAVEAFEFRYRATAAKRNSGGELYYTPMGGTFTDSRRWNIPPLVRDGKWHVMTVTTKSIINYEDWLSSGFMTNFRFDITNGEGGEIEVSEIRFRMTGSLAKAAAAKAEKFNGEDAWPDVKPQLLKSLIVQPEKYEPVGVEFRGGTATPRTAKAGEKILLKYFYRGSIPTRDALPIRLAITDETGKLKWNEEIVVVSATAVKRSVDDLWSIEFEYELPRYLNTCRCSVQMETPCLRATSGRAASARVNLVRLERDPKWPEKLTSKVVDVAGSPTFAINGEPVYPLWGTIANRRGSDYPTRHSSAPLNFVTVWTAHLSWWPRGEEFDPTTLDIIAEQHRREFPDAYFMWDISIYPPPDWRDANPGEMARDEQGNVNLDCGDKEINYSFASKKAYDDMEKIIEKVIRYLEASPYANRIAGYRINSGHTVEWLGWDPTRKETILDFSPVAQKGFEAFAKEHYPWITDFSVPTLAERRAIDGEGMVLWDQRKHARTIAYHDFYSTAVADGAIRMCRKAKELVDGKKLVGTYFGYVMTLNSGGCNQMRAHYALKHFLDAQATDFVMSPQNYGALSRQPGSQISDMKPFRTIQNHGMVPAIEDDTRTHLITPVRYSQTVTEELSIEMIRRNMGVSLCRNEPFYTYAITSGYEFDFPQFADDAAALAWAGRHALKVKTARKAEIAVVVSEEAIKSTPMLHGSGLGASYVGLSMQCYENTGKVKRYPAVGGAKNSAWIYQMAYTDIARIGAGADYLLAEDLVDNPGDYKLYIMQSCTKLTPGLVKAAKKLRDRKCTILWTYAPGYTSNDGNSVENMKTLTGMDFELCRDVTSPGVTLADGSVIGEFAYPPKVGRPLAPIFAAVKPDRVIGRYSNGAAGLASSKTGDATTIFSGSEFMRAPILRELAKEAGVHLFSDSFDIVDANEHFVSFHTRNSGVKTIKLPRKTSVVDIFNRRLIAKDVDSFEFEAPLHSSWLFYFGDDADELLAERD